MRPDKCWFRFRIALRAIRPMRGTSPPHPLGYFQKEKGLVKTLRINIDAEAKLVGELETFEPCTQRGL